MKSAANKILTLGVASFVAFGAAELTVRALGLAPEIAAIEINMPYGPFVLASDPRLIYQPKPGFGDFNRYGIRDRERELANTDGRFRIVVLGDSVAFGLCSQREGALALPDVFASRLEKSLNAESGPSEVFNLAVSGYNTTQEIAFLELKGLALSPDLVIVAYVFNDHIERAAELQRFTQHPDFDQVRSLRRAVRRNVLLQSALVRAVWYRLGGAEADDSGQGSEGASHDYAALVAEDLEPLRVLSERRGFRVLLVLFPRLGKYIDGTYRWAGQHDIVTRIAGEKGFDTFDLLPGFLQAGEGGLLRLRGRCSAMHLDEFGHRVAADLVFGHLTRVEGDARSVQ